MRIIRSGIRKLWRRPATFVTFGLLIGLLALIFLAVGATVRQTPSAEARAQTLLLLTFPGAYSLVLSFILGLGGLFAMVYGAAIAGSEWSWGTLKTAVARGESRWRYQTGSFVAVAIMVGIGLVAAFAIGVIVAFIAAGVAGVATDGASDSKTLQTLPELLARGWLALAEACAIGFAIATVARSQLAGIGVGIAVYFGEQFASIFLPDVVKYLPFNAANAVVQTAATSGAQGARLVTRLEPNVALLVVSAWLIGSLLVAAIFTERAEITG